MSFVVHYNHIHVQKMRENLESVFKKASVFGAMQLNQD